MYNEAGGLYEKCELWEKAAGVFVKSKNWLVQLLLFELNYVKWSVSIFILHCRIL